MATLYISYFANVDKLCAADIISSETITTSGTSAAASGTIPKNAAVAQIVSDTTHYVTFDNGTPTAAASNSAVQFAGVPLFLKVNGVSAARKIAAVTA